MPSKVDPNMCRFESCPYYDFENSKCHYNYCKMNKYINKIL